MNNFIKLKNLSKEYINGSGKLVVLNDINLDVNKGEMICVTGTSGSGKTTLMNILGCLDTASKGNYFLDGTDVLGLSSREVIDLRRKNIGFVFQSFNLIPILTAVENVEIALKYHGFPRWERKALARRAIEAVGLWERRDYLPTELSGGQQQRVAIARAIAYSPPLILADEPTGNLDPDSSARILKILKQINSGGTTVIIITHERELAKSVQREIRITDGKIG